MADNELEGKPLRYLIGRDGMYNSDEHAIVEVSYDWAEPVENTITIKYCNLFNEKYEEQSKEERSKYGPYLHTSDTAEEYGEGQIDPNGKGWGVNLIEQFNAAKRNGFKYIELDNPDAYHWKDVRSAIDLAGSYGLRVIAKNVLLCENSNSYLSHPNIYGCIVEQGAGSADSMEDLRKACSRHFLPVWFVGFGAKAENWCRVKAEAIRQGEHNAGMPYYNMGVTWSPRGEYTMSRDILKPIRIPHPEPGDDQFG
jgi:hypothetical protein